VVSSTLIKTTVHGGDPNWGRVIMALGNSGLEVELSKIDLSLGEIAVLEGGKVLPFNEEGVVRVLAQDEVPITAGLNMGTASATAWGCDMSEEYVTINSQYMT